jgi:tape measure domain-containing protein
MSTTVDQRVVEMQFDNKQFERNVSTTLSSLDKLKQSLNLTGAAKGLESVGTSAKGINLSGLTSAAETVGLKFNAMWTIADQALRNITNSAMNAGKQIVSALTIDPIKTGFSEYETQINAVQTILANTESKGSTLQDVNAALDTLNAYADKTIYNFTEMTRNIGTFTAAGVDLETSVTAIQGIANLAAVSGSTSQQASTAMYQLSQALSSGTVKLQDWNSIVNAGMGGQVFQDALKETARVHDVAIDAMIKKNGSFRETLSEGWLTADILTETLAKFTMGTEGLTEAQIAQNREMLKAQGYTDEQIDNIFKLGDTATNAATKVKTFSQLWDTLKEAAQSGWTSTWEIIVGDFEEAKELFTKVSDVVGKMIGDSAQARNELLQGWKDAGGRKDLIDGISSAFEGLMNIVKPIGEAFRNIFPPTTVDQLLGFTGGFKNLMASFAEFTASHGDRIRVIFEDIFSAIDVCLTVVKKLAGGIGSVFKGLINIVKPIGKAFLNIFPPTIIDQLLDRLLRFADGFSNLMASFAEFTASHSDQIQGTFEGIFSVIDIGLTFIKKLAGGIGKLLSHFTDLNINILDVTANIGDWLKGLRDTVKETDIFGIAIDKIVGFLGKIIEKLKSFGASIKNAFQSKGVRAFLDILSAIWGVILKIGARIAEIFAPLGQAISNLFGNVNFADVLNDGIFAAILVGVYKFIDNLNGPLESIKDMFDGLGGEDGFIGGLKDSLDSVRGCFEAYQNSLQAETIKKIAVAIAILAAAILVISSIDGDKLDHSLGAIGVMLVELIAALGVFSKISSGGKSLMKNAAAITGLATALLILSAAMKIMSTMSWSEIAVGITGTVAGLAALVGAVNLLPEGNVKRSAKAISKLATALVILAAAMKIMATMSWQEMALAMTGIVGGLGALVGAVNLLPKDAALRSAGMIGLATAMIILGAALKLLATMSWAEIGRGLATMAGSLVAIGVAMNIMPKDAALRSLGMIGLATAMIILGAALKSMGGMSWEVIGKGLAAMGGALAELAIALRLMNGAVAGAAALIIAAGALAIIAPVMKTLGGLSWEQIGKGLVALAGAFAVVGVAGLILAPLVTTLLGLAGAFALFGIATLGIGAGLSLIAVGITGIAASLTVGATAIVAGLAAIITGITDLIPTVILGLGDGILALCTVIAECAPAIVDTILVLLVQICESLATYTPMIANSLFDLLIGALNVLSERMPELVSAAVDVIGSFFTSIVAALKGMDTSSLIEGIVGAGLFTALIMALSALAPMIPGAMAGVLGMGAIIAEMALVLAAVGALAQIPGLSWLIGEGGDLLQQIGTAIGQFVGGLIGGIAEGATSTLPQVGSNLSNFMTNLQPFVDGMQNLDATMLDNAKTLASAILTLTAADLLSGIASFFKGGASLTDFGNEIAGFGTAMKEYSAVVAGIDTVAITASVSAGSTLVKMAKDIPSDGLFGSDGIDNFGKNVVKFGECMNEYSAEVVGINAAAIASSVSAARSLVAVAKQIPSDGAVGTDGIDNFGKNIHSFAKSLKKYSDTIADVSIGEISKSATVISSLISTINGMSGIDASGVDSFQKAIDNLSKTNVNGVVGAFNSAASKLKNVGKNMFDSIISGAKQAKSTFVSAIKSILLDGIAAVDGQTGKYKTAGTTIIGEFLNGVLSAQKNTSTAITTMLSGMRSSINAYRSNFYSAGAYLVDGFASGITANTYKATAKAKAMAAAAARAARKELDEHSPSRVGYEIGDFFGIGFVNGISDSVKTAYNAGGNMANAAESGLKNAFDKVSRIISGEVDVNPTIKPVLDLTDVRSGANAIGGMFGLQPSVGVLAHVGAVSSMMNQRNQTASNDDVVYAINKLQKALGNVGNTYNSIGNVTYDDGSNIAEAIRVITRTAIMEGRV